VATVVLYLVAWPVPIEPVSWKAPTNAGYTGDHAVNDRLAQMDVLAIGDHHGPEAVAIDDEGRLYVSTREGDIVRLSPDGSVVEDWAHTGGCPLGLDFDGQGNLVVADAQRRVPCFSQTRARSERREPLRCRWAIFASAERPSLQAAAPSKA
jgi:sugar lactone lactonase YvrE